MIEYVPFEGITDAQLRGIAASILAAPEDDRPDGLFVLSQLRRGVYRLFAWDCGLFVVSKKDKRLVIELMSASIWNRKDLAADLKRLAADWECDIVETMVFDSRLADAIVKVGGEVEAFVVILPVRD